MYFQCAITFSRGRQGKPGGGGQRLASSSVTGFQDTLFRPGRAVVLQSMTICCNASVSAGAQRRKGSGAEGAGGGEGEGARLAVGSRALGDEWGEPEIISLNPSEEAMNRRGSARSRMRRRAKRATRAFQSAPCDLADLSTIIGEVLVVRVIVPILTCAWGQGRTRLSIAEPAPKSSCPSDSKQRVGDTVSPPARSHALVPADPLASRVNCEGPLNINDDHDLRFLLSKRYTNPQLISLPPSTTR